MTLSIFDFRILVSVAVLFLSLFYEFFSGSFLSIGNIISATFGTAKLAVIARSLSKLSMYWAFDYNFCSIIFVFYFGIIVFVSMNQNGF